MYGETIYGRHTAQHQQVFLIVYGLSPSYLKDFICLKDTSYNFGIQLSRLVTKLTM